MHAINVGACRAEIIASSRANIKLRRWIISWGHVKLCTVVAQTASDDSMKLPTNNDIVLVPEALSTPVTSAKLKHICTFNDNTGHLRVCLHGKTHRKPRRYMDRRLLSVRLRSTHTLLWSRFKPRPGLSAAERTGRTLKLDRKTPYAA